MKAISLIIFPRSCCETIYPMHMLDCPVGRLERGLSPGEPESSKFIAAVKRMRDEDLTELIV